MRGLLGLSIGATQLVAARADGTSILRRAELPWRGTVLTGFVERVGDPVPIVAPDGSAHSADRLLAAAVTDLVSVAGRPGERFGVAVPAHWSAHVVDRVRALLPGVPVTSDATAALVALRAHPGLPARGVVVLCDFGATGTSITLADSARNFAPIGPTLRYDEFSGDLIDRAVLAHLLAEANLDPEHTSAVASLRSFRDQCRGAKERLSRETATGLAGPVPGATVRLTRRELDALLREPIDGLLAAVDDQLRRAGMRPAELAALATVGGGARIPIVTQRLSEALRCPVTTTPDAQTVAATGAAILAGWEPQTATRFVVAPGGTAHARRAFRRRRATSRRACARLVAGLGRAGHRRLRRIRGRRVGPPAGCVPARRPRRRRRRAPGLVPAARGAVRRSGVRCPHRGRRARRDHGRRRGEHRLGRARSRA